MKNFRLLLTAVVLVLPLACGKASIDTEVTSSISHSLAPEIEGVPRIDVDAGSYPNPQVGQVASADSVVMRDLPTVANDPAANWGTPRKKNSQRPRTMISPEEADRLRAVSLALQPQSRVQVIAPSPRGPASTTPELQSGFEALNYDDANSGTPPDPEMAVGPNHVIAVVNSMVEVYDRNGTTVSGPTLTDTFFSGVPGCSGTFDPNALYDEKADRFFVGIDSGSGPGTDNGYCFAVSATGDPTGTWYRYSFDATSGPGDFFDYPHAGIGDEAIFVGGNVYSATFHADVWAIKKVDVYNNVPLGPTNFVTNSINGDTPQPMNAHGFAQGTWPSGNTHYILSDGSFDGTTMEVHLWTDPFGVNSFISLGSVDLNGFTGVNGGYPIDTPQSGNATSLQGNDYRVQDAEYRNGHLWMSQTIACNPGGGTVNCVRWAEIDPTGPSIVQAGVFASDGEFRTFADLAVNHCGDMTIGYTKSSANIFPGVYFTGRLGTDPANTVGAEGEAMAGELTYSGFDGSPFRWGDYTEATSDPDGVHTWYLGEYSRNNLSGTKWATHISRYSTNCVAPGSSLVFSDGFDSGDTSRWTIRHD